MSAASAPAAVSTPVVMPLSRAALWLFGALIIGLALYYVIGVDQGAYSVVGTDTHVHEVVHDARHFLGFPCH